MIDSLISAIIDHWPQLPLWANRMWGRIDTPLRTLLADYAETGDTETKARIVLKIEDLLLTHAPALLDRLLLMDTGGAMSLTGRGLESFETIVARREGDMEPSPTAKGIASYEGDYSSIGTAKGIASGRGASTTGSSPAPATLRYLNAGFFTADRDDEPVSSKLPLTLAGAAYRLGVNAGEFWGLGTPGTPIPDDVLTPLFEQHPVLMLDVVVRSFTVTPPVQVQPLLLAARGNSPMLYFPVVFPDAGRHTIEIDLIYCGHLLQSRRVVTYLVEQSGDPVPESAWPVQDASITFTRTAALDPASLQALANRPSQVTVVVERSQTYNRVGLCFYDTTAGVEKLGFEQSEITDANLGKLLKSARKRLKSTMEAYVGGIGGSDQQLTKQLGLLADVGRSFYCALLPGLSNADRSKVTSHKLLAGLHPGAIIQVAPLSAQLSVPWELLYERPLRAYKEGRTRLCPSFRTHGPAWADCPDHADPFVVCPHGFWGYRYIVEQLPCRAERSDPPKPALPLFIRDELPLQLVALVNPSLTNWKTHSQTLTNLAPQSRLTVDPRVTLDDIFLVLKQQTADILYIYAHGGQDDLGRPCLKVANDDLIVEQDLNAESVTFENTQPLVILNACESASYSPEDFESFILYFCRHGAAGVIGAQCGVTELLVDGMMKPFLTAFLKQTPAGEALYLARRGLLFGDRPDPRGLAYSLFAAADLTIAQAVNP